MDDFREMQSYVLHVIYIEGLQATFILYIWANLNHTLTYIH